MGSLPGPDPETAMTTALDVLGPFLRTLPDGETGDRRNWVISIVDGLRAHPDLELSKPGDWSDYDRTPVMKVRRGRTLYGANLDFGHLDAVTDSHPVFRDAVARVGRPDIAFQEGVPGDFDLAMFTLGPAGGLRHRRAFTEATLTEIRRVAAVTGPDTLFQIEVPVELVLLAKAPAAARPALARVLARNVTRLAAAAPEGTRFGVHLCLGDMNNRAFGTMTDAAPLVLLANAVADGWPDGRTLDLLHAPFAAADQPATTDPEFYAPLTGLRVPPGTRFAAGFAHEAQPLADQLTIRSRLDDHLGREVTVSAACGLGRRDDDAARAVLDRTAELCTA
ncbi:hypothetical protein ACXR2U_10825 [Jatrophihabitans sp. YIM 134969]